MSDEEPFQRRQNRDDPGAIGATWWQEGLVQADPVARRAALKALFGTAIALTVVGGTIGLVSAASSSSKEEDDFRTDNHPALDMQRQYGWNFGAAADPLVFDGISYASFDKSSLATLETDLSPSQSAYRPFFVPSLLQSPNATRKTIPAGDPDVFTPLADVLRPIFTSAMDVAYRRGRALAALFDGEHHAKLSSIAVIVDLAGPEAVAFAAGASSALDPVFLFDNWPHPHGVVPAHMTLAACAYYQPLFRKARALLLTGAPPMFVLDRARLAAYTDNAKQFDNRYVARVPGVAALAKVGVSRVLYVTPSDTESIELDDLNDDFLYTVSQGSQVKMVSATAFLPGATPSSPSPSSSSIQFVTRDGGAPVQSGPIYYYGGSQETNEWFWNDYPWSTPYVAKGMKPPIEPLFPRPGKDYQPVARVSAFSSGAATGASTSPRPPTFGLVPVVVAAATGVILGAAMSRSGSWTRSSSWGGG